MDCWGWISYILGVSLQWFLWALQDTAEQRQQTLKLIGNEKKKAQTRWLVEWEGGEQANGFY